MEYKNEPNWTCFYQTLAKIGPKMLKGVPRVLKEWLDEAAVETDRLYSYGLQTGFYYNWNENSHENAVLSALSDWERNVHVALNDAVDYFFYGESQSKIISLKKSVSNVKLITEKKYIDKLINAASSPEITEEPSEPIVEKLSFELLPAEIWFSDLSMKKYFEDIGKREKGKGIEIDWERIEKIKSLNPVKCYVGTSGWQGYIVFEFDYTEKVILECPVFGSATYILSGDWRKMIGHSRKYLRTMFPDDYEKIVHKGDWLLRIKNLITIT